MSRMVVGRIPTISTPTIHCILRRIAPSRLIYQECHRNKATESDNTVNANLPPINNNNNSNHDSTDIIDVSNTLRVYHIQQCVDSTQDEAKRLLQRLYCRDWSRTTTSYEEDEEGRPLDNNQSLLLQQSPQSQTLQSSVQQKQQQQQKEQYNTHKAGRKHLVVLADTQSRGRGTSGRSWVASTKGNLYMTYCFPMEEIAMDKLTLLPIGIGVLIAEALDKSMTAMTMIDDVDGTKSTLDVTSGSTGVESPCTTTTTTSTDRNEFLCSSSTVTRPTVKWPNDVLLGGRKVAGTLIETHRIQCTDDGTGRNVPGGDYWLMVGIGVNLESHPTVLDTADTNHNPNTKIVARTLDPKSTPPPRQATSLRQHCYCEQKQNIVIPSPVAFGIELACTIKRLVHEELSSKGNKDRHETTSSLSSPYSNRLHSNYSSTTSPAIVDRWRSWSNLGEKYTVRDTGETVQPVDIEPDGRLRVIGSDGQERTLVSDYFI